MPKIGKKPSKETREKLSKSAKIAHARKAIKEREGKQGKNFLTESELERFLKAAKKTRNGARDHCMVMMAYRHGFRVSELIDIRLDELDLEGAQIFVRRSKNSLSTSQPIEGDELRALRAWLRERSASSQAGSPFLFFGIRGPFTRQAINSLFIRIAKAAKLPHIHPHMLRHTCGHLLANRQTPTRTIQNLLGHKSIKHTVLYTALNSEQFRDLWRKRKY